MAMDAFAVIAALPRALAAVWMAWGESNAATTARCRATRRRDARRNVGFGWFRARAEPGCWQGRARSARLSDHVPSARRRSRPDNPRPAGIGARRRTRAR